MRRSAAAHGMQPGFDPRAKKQETAADGDGSESGEWTGEWQPANARVSRTFTALILILQAHGLPF